jgi:elongation factor 1-alpha
MTEKSPNMPWWFRRFLFEKLYTVESPKRPLNKSLRLPVQDVDTINGVGTVLFEIGIMKSGMSVVFAPFAIKTEVKIIEMHHESLPEALT